MKSQKPNTLVILSARLRRARQEAMDLCLESRFFVPRLLRFCFVTRSKTTGVLRMTLLVSCFTLFSINGLLRGETVENIHSFSAQRIDGKETQLSDFKGKTLLIVNTASKCGFTPQYKPLEALYEKYKDRGFEVLAFPANNFGFQEPGSNEQIKQFCELNYKVSFPLFAKISVKGKDIHPLYRYLTTESGFNGDVTWNFNKFLVAPDGRVTARFGSKTDPLSPDLIRELEKVLSN